MNVLILEQTPEDALRIEELFGLACDQEFVFEKVNSFEKMRSLFATNNYDILILYIDDDPEATVELFEEAVDSLTAIVFTSQENNLMIEALNHSISGYLTKPITQEQFSITLQRVKEKRSLQKEKIKKEYRHFKKLVQDRSVNRIALTTLDGYVIVHYDDIIRCAANGNYTSVYFYDGSFLMLTKTLKHYASKLEDHGFFRVHKTHLVNLKYIRSYVKGKNSYIELKDGSNIEVSSRKKQNLVEVLNK